MATEKIFKCLVVDDEYPATVLLNSYISRHSSLQLVASTTNAVNALSILQVEPIDLLFLDIQMPELNGIEFLKAIAGKNIKVILTTAFREYALEGYEYNVVDYLLKPITFVRFENAVLKARERINGTDPYECTGEIFVKVAYQLQKINFTDIIFIESLGDYVAFYTTTGKLTSLHSLKQLENKLPPKCFIRIHRSYIVNRKFIAGINKGNIVIGEKKIPVGATYSDAVKKILDSLS